MHINHLLGITIVTEEGVCPVEVQLSVTPFSAGSDVRFPHKSQSYIKNYNFQSQKPSLEKKWKKCPNFSFSDR